MTRHTPRPVRRIGAGLAALAVTGVLLPTSSQAAVSHAAEGAGDGVDVVNTETVQVYMDADGGIDTKRVYEQLTLTGDGDVELANPIEESGLRNLDGFSGFSVEDGEQQVDMSVDGVERLRTVSTYTGDLPLDVDIAYELDGKSVDASDIVGESGHLEVTYTVKNVTAKPQEISYADGTGSMVTETVDVPVPMVGSLTTVLPPNFSEVQSGQANMAGDGKGGTKMSFTMTLVPPIGSDTATFGYTADIEDGLVPRASISALPVNPLESPTFKTAATSYQGGAQTGEALAAGATEIDTNLLKLRDGAGDLISGLVQLRDGAGELETGLAGRAAPGARQLSAGAGELRTGLGKIDDGAGQLADGARKLADGTGEAKTGSQKLNAGLKKISGGLDQLAATTTGLPKAQAGITLLQDGVGQILAGFGGGPTDQGLINGLSQLENGAAILGGGLRQLRGDGASSGLGLAKFAVDGVQQGLAPAVAENGSLDDLAQGLRDVQVYCNPAAQQQCVDAHEGMRAGVLDSKAQLTDANGYLIDVSGGLGTAIAGLDNQLIPGVGQLNTGLTDAKNGAIKLKAGVASVGGGLDQLEQGLTTAVAGVLKLANGANDAEAGSGDLTDGLSQLDTGAGQLADGAGELSTGTGSAVDGSGQIADGAEELSTGLDDAADGSGLLSDGLRQAASAAPAIPDGAARLSKEGMSQLITAGEDTAKEYGQLYATVQAGSKRAEAESMAYGAPEQARGLTAYSFEITGEDGEGGRNTLRALGALVVVGLGLGAFALRRRMG
ncbi:hypothetical protein [Nocardioides sp. LHG3406-4]|uniref:hypothetical protein n=1 Tax=Nocardioides sp. LHG3406-4 TaxID=2804575 RepID=UPI003CF676CA